jgi:hypothetical protein
MLARRIQGVMRQYGPEVAFFTVEALNTLYLGNVEPMNEVLERELGEEPASWARATYPTRLEQHKAYLTRLGQLVQAYTAAGRWPTDNQVENPNREWGPNLWHSLHGPPCPSSTALAVSTQRPSAASQTTSKTAARSCLAEPG